jgi:predicted nuclease of predicted toxin-antitoxin system
MRILANENFPGDAVEALRAHGYDISWVRTEAPGSNDREVLRKAQSEKRILLTFDKDFGELAYRYKLPAPCGVILLRLSAPSPADLVRFIVASLASRTDWAGHFSVIEKTRIRMARLPQ